MKVQLQGYSKGISRENHISNQQYRNYSMGLNYYFQESTSHTLLCFKFPKNKPQTTKKSFHQKNHLFLSLLPKPLQGLEGSRMVLRELS